MRTTLGVAGVVAAVAAIVAPATPASACDPGKFPYCQTYCEAVAGVYGDVAAASDLPFPAWPRTGLAGCP